MYSFLRFVFFPFVHLAVIPRFRSRYSHVREKKGSKSMILVNINFVFKYLFQDRGNFIIMVSEDNLFESWHSLVEDGCSHIPKLCRFCSQSQSRFTCLYPVWGGPCSRSSGCRPARPPPPSAVHYIWCAACPPVWQGTPRQVLPEKFCFKKEKKSSVSLSTHFIYLPCLIEHKHV